MQRGPTNAQRLSGPSVSKGRKGTVDLFEAIMKLRSTKVSLIWDWKEAPVWIKTTIGNRYVKTPIVVSIQVDGVEEPEWTVCLDATFPSKEMVGIGIGTVVIWGFNNG